MKDIKKEIETQDNRCTALPIYYTIRETKDEYRPAVNQTDALIHDGEILDAEACLAFVLENEACHDDVLSDNCIEDIGDLTPDQAMNYLEYNMEEFDALEIVPVVTYDKFFLTEKACEEYIKVHAHNLTRPVSYVKSLRDNPEMKKVIEMILGVKE